MSFREYRVLFLLAGLALFVLWIPLAKYLLVPLKGWRRRTTPVTRARPLAPAMASEEVRGKVREVAATVAPLGFELVEVSDVNDGAAVVLRARNPSTSDYLLDYHAGSLRWQVVRTQFADGREVVTSNAPLPSVFSRPRTLHVCGLPPATDLPALIRAHGAHVRLKAQGGTPVTVPVGINYVMHQEERVMESQCALGIYRRVGDEYRPTLRGAFLTTWRLLPPLRGMRGRANDRLARTLLAG